MKHLVCYSGGHSSALVAIEVVRKFGKTDVILLNHDIHSSVEDADIKRFKREVASHLELEITYANHPKWNERDQFDVCIDAKAFKVGAGTALCTNRLKTEPFERYLAENFAGKGCVIYYGFDKNETDRMQRRTSHLALKGYRTDYPLALWSRTIHSTEEISIKPPNTYSVFKHANCVGCLKAKMQHWYVVFCVRPDIWEKAKKAEEAIGYSIMPDKYLEEFEPKFQAMKCDGVPATEKIEPQAFWSSVAKRFENPDQLSLLDTRPCECVV